VFAEDEAALLTGAAGSPGELEAMVAARVRGLPLEQVIGWAEFRGLRILVDPGVFVPRRRSEFLVETAISLAQPASRSSSRVISGAMAPFMTHDHGRQPEASSAEPDMRDISPPGRPVVVDLCCGTGALGLATAAAVPSAELHAADLDPAAVACARRNVEPAGGRVYQGDLFAPLPASLRGRAGIVICNGPYVPTSEIAFMPAEARDHEARVALDGGDDGLAVLRRVCAQAPGWLAPGGTLLVETSQRQAGPMAEAMTAAGLSARVHHDDEMGATVITGTAPAARAANSWRRA
jgi:release factor glutamine methyltransferase